MQKTESYLALLRDQQNAEERRENKNNKNGDKDVNHGRRVFINSLPEVQRLDLFTTICFVGGEAVRVSAASARSLGDTGSQRRRRYRCQVTDGPRPSASPTFIKEKIIKNKEKQTEIAPWDASLLDTGCEQGKRLYLTSAVCFKSVFFDLRPPYRRCVP